MRMTSCSLKRISHPSCFFSWNISSSGLSQIHTPLDHLFCLMERDQLCSASDILECKGPIKVAGTVAALLKMHAIKPRST
ncbi:unnamed protein product [Darwinula stevensoni]|uniref:Uncharacterized protein n=1 Tax=Darwinula stevensoni TaxID=69355 RepID=A0A7R9FPX6_9CRUS|nr:unnamed protein product [Darwinula stevensoni]CAG0898642.1 unnamed protein product [Darwinula stevensoni]